MSTEQKTPAKVAATMPEKEAKKVETASFTVNEEQLAILDNAYEAHEKSDNSSLAVFRMARDAYRKAGKGLQRSVTLRLNQHCDTYAVTAYANRLKKAIALSLAYKKAGVVAKFDELHYYNIEALVTVYDQIIKQQALPNEERRSARLTNTRLKTIRTELEQIWSDGMAKIDYNNAITEKIGLVRKELKMDEEAKFSSFVDNFEKTIESLDMDQLVKIEKILAAQEARVQIALQAEEAAEEAETETGEQTA